MIHEHGRPKSNSQEPRGSLSDYITLVPKDTCQNTNHQKPVGSTYDLLALIIKKIHPVRTHNNITAPSINNTHEIDITQNCNILHQKNADINKIRRHHNAMQTSS